jgi:hypothetical protein
MCLIKFLCITPNGCHYLILQNKTFPIFSMIFIKNIKKLKKNPFRLGGTSRFVYLLVLFPD